jgi:hypothetical protein
MPSPRSRLRAPPTWHAGLRRGTVRDTMTAYLAEHPELERQLLAALEEVRARGGEPVCMRRVKQLRVHVH